MNGFCSPGCKLLAQATEGGNLRASRLGFDSVDDSIRHSGRHSYKSGTKLDFAVFFIQNY